jgi:hypothetical protein
MANSFSVENMKTLEQRSEAGYDGVNQIRKLMQAWNDRLTLSNLRLPERYIKGDIELLIHLRAKRAGYPTNFGAVLNYWNSGVREKRDWRAQLNECRLRGRLPLHERKTGFANRIGDNEQESVLVEIVKFVEFPEAIVPTLVRVERINEIYGSRAHSLYFGANTGFVFGRSLVNGEIGLLVRSAAVGLDKLPSEVVETAPKLVNGFSSENGEFQRRLANDTNLVNELMSLRVYIDNKSIVVGFEEGTGESFEVTDVLFGPFDFRPNAN